MKKHIILLSAMLLSALPLECYAKSAHVAPHISEAIRHKRHDLPTSPAGRAQYAAEGKLMWEGENTARTEDLGKIYYYMMNEYSGSVGVVTDADGLRVVFFARELKTDGSGPTTHFHAYVKEGEAYRLTGRYLFSSRIPIAEGRLRVEEDGVVVVAEGGEVDNSGWLEVSRKFLFAEPWDECTVLNTIESNSAYFDTTCHRMRNAVHRGDRRAIEDMIARGVSLNQPSFSKEDGEDGWTLFHDILHYANFANDPSMVAFLIEHGADPEVRTPHGDTAILVSMLRAKGTGRLLLAAGASPSVANADGVTPLMRAASHERDAAFLRELIAAGADASARDARGRTALHYAMTPFMLTSWPHEGNAEALEDAIVQSMLDMTEVLVQSGADINAQDAEGNTPLHALVASCASDRAAAAVARKLIASYGADAGRLNRRGKSPLGAELDKHRPLTREVLKTNAH